jgi:formylmethanofuran dehydrogenase subunit C
MMRQLHGAPTQLNAVGRFSKYKGENTETIRSASPAKSAFLASAERAWDSFGLLSEVDSAKGGLGGRNRLHLLWESPDMIRQLTSRIALRLEGQLSKQDVFEFCIWLKSRESEEEFASKAGLFLSAMINAGIDKEYKVITDHLDKHLHYLGVCMEGKTLGVKGPCGDLLGAYMDGGFLTRTKITIDGFGGSDMGRGMMGGEIISKEGAGIGTAAGMQGGRITIFGNVYESIGEGMRGGTLTVNGLVVEAGKGMEGGKIVINGNAWASLGDGMQGGKIIVNGDVIVSCVIGSARPEASAIDRGTVIVNGAFDGTVSPAFRGTVRHKGKKFRVGWQHDS